MKVFVIIPTYNEKENIARIIKEIFSLNIPDLHLLIVDDNSPDQTAKIVEGRQKEFPNLHLLKRTGKLGLGTAYIEGIKLAFENNAEAIIQMDADFSHNPKDIPRLLKGLNSKDFVIGSRYIPGGKIVNWPKKRLFLSSFANNFARVILFLPIHDLTGGFNAWKKKTLEGINFREIKTDGYGFLLELKTKAYRSRFSYQEIPITFTERREGQSKISKKIIWQAFLLVFKLRFFNN